ncbi:MAG: tetratricopeptide repeat protein [Acidobacteria bacterium]|nr:tetratricopeptide repeat protein [Acidobacteriota bacterium]
MSRPFHLALCILLAVPAALADVIVLKSGRRITATNAVDEGDRVSYETTAGRLSVRKDLVERIERSGSAESGALTVTDEVRVVPHIERGDEEIVNQAVHDGGVDGNYIARLENDPQSSSTIANRIAIAHHAAAQFELERGNMDSAVAHYRRALTFAPSHLGVLLSISYLHLRLSEYSQALEYLERGQRVAPNSPDVAKLLGWAYYGLNKIDPAVREWKRALSLREDSDVERALAKALKDQQVESEFREGETRHFTLRYHGGAAPQLAREILRTLEDHFRTIDTELNFTPPEAIGVLLYTQQDFVDITRAPSWAGALNDGRIRIPVQGLTSVTPHLSSTLKHELTHSFVHQKTRGRAPVWMQEGIAQWMEGKRSRDNASLLLQAYERKLSLPLQAMEGAYSGMPSDVASYAYAWSLGVVEYIVQSNGVGDLVRILDRMNTERNTEEAVRSVLKMGYSDLEAETVKYLKRTYER